ncbi:MAG: hypothetical protein FWG22_02195 [Prolixibacteraceae bacterium]|nr:hypothetical protein [Prolixibacteraceae bacterium]
MLTGLYERYPDKNDISFFPAEQVSPWSKTDVQKYIYRSANIKVLEKKLEKAIAIHYFLGSWINNLRDSESCPAPKKG